MRGSWSGPARLEQAPGTYHRARPRRSHGFASDSLLSRLCLFKRRTAGWVALRAEHKWLSSFSREAVPGLQARKATILIVSSGRTTAWLTPAWRKDGGKGA